MIGKLLKHLPTSISQGLTATYFKARALRTVGFSGTHSSALTVAMTKMEVKILPALEDNYMYLIIDKETNEAAIVDPVHPASVMSTVATEKVNLLKILTTHHHWDHSGGNEELVANYKDAKLEVYGYDDRINGCTNKVKDNDKLKIGNLNVTCIYTPCHTSGHICYLVEADDGEKAVFTGDTLFSGGCGRFFEGTADQMYTALITKLSALSNETKVFCGHEYTVANLAFAKHVEPTNADVLAKIEWAVEKRAAKIPTVPSTIGDEKKINPFMRVDCASVQAHTKTSDGINTMAAIRTEKDGFTAP